MHIKFKQPYLFQYLVIILYKFTLDAVYIVFISPTYKYSGMAFHPFLYKYLISIGFTVLVASVLVRILKQQNISSFVLLVLNLIYFIPGSTLYSLAGLNDYYFLYFTIFWLFLHILTVYAKDFHFIKFRENNSMHIIILTVSLITIIGIVIISGVYNHFKLHFGILDVYKLRFAKRFLVLPSWVLYFQPIAATMAPVLMVYYFVKKKYLLVTIFILIQLLMFGFGANKATLFTLLVAFMVCFFKVKNAKRLTISFFTLLNASVFLELCFSKFSYVGYLIINRISFIPSLLSFQYYDFFSTHNLLYLRESFLRHFGFSTGYSLESPFLISKMYLGNSITYSNNGLLGDAFSNFGWFSLLIYPFIISLLLKVFDSVSGNLDFRIIIIVSIIISFGLSNIQLFGFLLTNGILFLIMLLYFLQTERNLSS